MYLKGLFKLAGNVGKILAVAFFLLSENQTAIIPITIYTIAVLRGSHLSNTRV